MLITRRVLGYGCQMLVVMSWLTAPANAQPMPDINNGQNIAARECAGCHGMNGRQSGSIQGIIAPTFEEIARRPDRTPEMLEARILNPHWPMPGLPLQAREVRDVVGYILSLK